MKKAVIATGMVLALLFLQGPVSAQEVTLKTHNGPVVGVKNGTVSVFKGIPYAQAPVGDLRFAPPRDAAAWKEPLQARSFGSMAMQAGPDNGSEDALTLNIWTPAQAGAEKKLPVYVYIHGGAFIVGSNQNPTWDGMNFAQDGVILVTINYRLGALGFYASQTTYDAYKTTGNWGILDQIKALEWVNNNIAFFGGDPKNITVGGESAGSYSVSALMLSPLAKGLFQKAIMESGDILSLPGNNYYSKGDLARSIEVSRMFGLTFGADDTPAGLAKLRLADPLVLTYLSAVDLDFTKMSAFSMTPVYDGRVIPKDPVNALYEGRINPVKLLYGFNRDEGSLFIPEGLSRPQYEAFVYKTFGADAAGQLLQRYPVNADNSPTQRARQLFKYGMFTAGPKSFGDVYARSGADVWAYHFAYAGKDLLEKGLGAAHASELKYVFGNFKSEPDETQKKLSAEMRTRWLNFIKNGDPNVGQALPTQVKWPKYDAENTTMMEFDVTVKTIVMPEKSDLEFMQKILFNK